MGPARQPTRLLFRRHDAKNLVNETRHVRSRPPGALQRDLHDQMEPHRSGHAESQHESDLGVCQFRFHGAIVGRRAGSLHTHAHQTHRTGILGGVQPGRKVLSER